MLKVQSCIATTLDHAVCFSGLVRAFTICFVAFARDHRIYVSQTVTQNQEKSEKL